MRAILALRSASRQRIDALEALCPKALPSSYLGYLEQLGEGCGGFVLFAEHQCRASELLAAPPHPHDPHDPHDPARYFRVAIYQGADLGVGGSVYLDMSQSDGEDAPLIIMLHGSPEVEALGSSFENRVKMRAFESYELKPRRAGISISLDAPQSNEASFCEVINALLQAGLEEVLEPTSLQWFGRAERLSAHAQRYAEAGAFRLEVRGEDKREVSALIKRATRGLRALGRRAT